MNRFIFPFYFFSFILTGSGVRAQSSGDYIPQVDSLESRSENSGRKFRIRLSPAAALTASASIGYGFVNLGNHDLRRLDLMAKNEFSIEHPHPKFRLDDYLQFAPGATVFILRGFGVHGRNPIGDQGGVYLLSNLILNLSVQTLKRATDTTRPDGSRYSFPSGHTAEAFASAEFLSQEYGSTSPLYPIFGYLGAAATGYLRMYNNKHWLSDVIAGAGIGFMSTRASYWLYPRMKKIFSRGKANTVMIMPSYSPNSFIVGAIGIF